MPVRPTYVQVCKENVGIDFSMLISGRMQKFRITVDALRVIAGEMDNTAEAMEKVFDDHWMLIRDAGQLDPSVPNSARIILGPSSFPSDR